MGERNLQQPPHFQRAGTPLKVNPASTLLPTLQSTNRCTFAGKHSHFLLL